MSPSLRVNRKINEDGARFFFFPPVSSYRLKWLVLVRTSRACTMYCTSWSLYLGIKKRTAWINRNVTLCKCKLEKKKTISTKFSLSSTEQDSLQHRGVIFIQKAMIYGLIRIYPGSLTEILPSSTTEYSTITTALQPHHSQTDHSDPPRPLLEV